jgi:hypothetical protein
VSTQSWVEKIHVSPLGPALRSVTSRFLAPMWILRGRPAPAPPHRKRQIVNGYAKRSEVTAFVETGTFRGDTLAVVSRSVPASISIELDERLARLARQRFARRSGVSIRHADSAAELPSVVGNLDGPALFWLDGHFSDGVTALGDQVTPIEDELVAVLGPDRPDHVVLIDDARLFTGTGGYPSLERIETLVGTLRPGWTFAVADDIIRVHAPA